MSPAIRRLNPTPFLLAFFVEAENAGTGNLVENVPGTRVGAGWGPYLRNVLVSNNMVSDALIGIAVSVDGNLISGASAAAIAGTRWQEIATADLTGAADRYPNVDVGKNAII